MTLTKDSNFDPYDDIIRIYSRPEFQGRPMAEPCPEQSHFSRTMSAAEVATNITIEIVSFASRSHNF